MIWIYAYLRFAYCEECLKELRHIAFAMAERSGRCHTVIDEPGMYQHLLRLRAVISFNPKTVGVKIV